MAKRVRDPGEDPALLRGCSESARQADDPARSIQFSVGHRFSAADVRQGDEPLVLEPSSFHRASGRGRAAAQERAEEGPGTALRYRGERGGTGRWLDPDPS